MQPPAIGLAAAVLLSPLTPTLTAKSAWIPDHTNKPSNGETSSNTSQNGSTSAEKNTKKIEDITFNLQSFPETISEATNADKVPDEWKDQVSQNGYFLGFSTDKEIDFNDLTFSIDNGNAVLLQDYSKTYNCSYETGKYYVVYKTDKPLASVEITEEKEMSIPYRINIMFLEQSGTFPISVYYKGTLLASSTIYVSPDSFMVKYGDFVRGLEEEAWTGNSYTSDAEKLSALGTYCSAKYSYSDFDCKAGARVIYWAAIDLGYSPYYKYYVDETINHTFSYPGNPGGHTYTMVKIGNTLYHFDAVVSHLFLFL